MTRRCLLSFSFPLKIIQRLKSAAIIFMPINVRSGPRERRHSPDTSWKKGGLSPVRGRSAPFTYCSEREPAGRRGPQPPASGPACTGGCGSHTGLPLGRKLLGKKKWCLFEFPSVHTRRTNGADWPSEATMPGLCSRSNAKLRVFPRSRPHPAENTASFKGKSPLFLSQCCDSLREPANVGEGHRALGGLSVVAVGGCAARIPSPLTRLDGASKFSPLCPDTNMDQCPGNISYLWLPTVTLLSFLDISVPTLLAPERLPDLRQVKQAHAHALLQAGLQVPPAAAAEHHGERVPAEKSPTSAVSAHGLAPVRAATPGPTGDTCPGVRCRSRRAKA